MGAEPEEAGGGAGDDLPEGESCGDKSEMISILLSIGKGQYNGEEVMKKTI